MSSKIEVQKICEYCGNEFIARTTVTRYCSDVCAKRAYKARKRDEKVKKSNSETKTLKYQSIEEIKAKEFLTVKEVAHLLNCSVRSVYYYIENGTINAVNIGQRITRIKRSEIDKLFEQPHHHPKENNAKIDFNLTISEAQKKFNFSEKGFFDFCKRNNIPKKKTGKYVYVPESIINNLLK